MTISRDKIKNFNQVSKIYGSNYGFHDAEIISIKLHSDINTWKSSASIQVHAFTMTSEIVNGKYKLTNHNVITFVIKDIGRLNIENWSYQNVAFGIVFEDSAYGLIMKCDSSCGSDFEIEGKEITVENIKTFP
jgi:hypothetical protein